jgi:hypothetical protein
MSTPKTRGEAVLLDRHLRRLEIQIQAATAEVTALVAGGRGQRGLPEAAARNAEIENDLHDLEDRLEVLRADPEVATELLRPVRPRFARAWVALNFNQRAVGQAGAAGPTARSVEATAYERGLWEALLEAQHQAVTARIEVGDSEGRVVLEISRALAAAQEYAEDRQAMIAAEEERKVAAAGALREAVVRAEARGFMVRDRMCRAQQARGLRAAGGAALLAAGLAVLLAVARPTAAGAGWPGGTGEAGAGATSRVPAGAPAESSPASDTKDCKQDQAQQQVGASKVRVVIKLVPPGGATASPPGRAEACRPCLAPPAALGYRLPARHDLFIDRSTSTAPSPLSAPASSTYTTSTASYPTARVRAASVSDTTTAAPGRTSQLAPRTCGPLALSTSSGAGVSATSRVPEGAPADSSPASDTKDRKQDQAQQQVGAPKVRVVVKPVPPGVVTASSPGRAEAARPGPGLPAALGYRRPARHDRLIDLRTGTAPPAPASSTYTTTTGGPAIVEPTASRRILPQAARPRPVAVKEEGRRPPSQPSAACEGEAATRPAPHGPGQVAATCPVAHPRPGPTLLQARPPRLSRSGGRKKLGGRTPCLSPTMPGRGIPPVLDERINKRNTRERDRTAVIQQALRNLEAASLPVRVHGRRRSTLEVLQGAIGHLQVLGAQLDGRPSPAAPPANQGAARVARVRPGGHLLEGPSAAAGSSKFDSQGATVVALQRENDTLRAVVALADARDEERARDKIRRMAERRRVEDLADAAMKERPSAAGGVAREKLTFPARRQ